MMKKLLLFGDSIRMGYDAYVRESWEGKARVFSPQENCMHTAHMLRNLHAWVQNQDLYDADAVHFNAGLWDTVRIYGDEPLISLENYKANLRRIIARLKFLFPKATLIFATSTPCQEEGFIADFEMRYNRDVELYNAAACEICKKEGVQINDLYTLLKDCPPSYHSDQTHYYTADATELIGSQVNRVLCQAAGVDYRQLILPNKADYDCPNRGIPDKLAFIRQGDYFEAR